MKIKYDKNIKIAGLGLVPWTRLGPEKWLPNYAIASLYDWDLPPTAGLPKVCALSARTKELPKLARLNTQAMIRAKSFQELLQQELPGYDLLTYKPVDVPKELAGRKFLMVDRKLAGAYENKVEFRQKFKDTLNFPPFEIIERKNLKATESSFKKILGSHDRVIIQDETLSGGKGTYNIGSFEEYLRALKALEGLSDNPRVVVSEVIANARERSIQVCTTAGQIVTGPLQRPIVSNPLLANNDVPEGDKFCGAQILRADQNTDLHKQARKIAQEIGANLKAEGYRGIFGIDFLLDENNKLYVIEVNPRITGVTPLLTALFNDTEDVPFYLLHLLELGKYSYEVPDSRAEFAKEGGLLVLHSLKLVTVKISSMPPSGTYTVKGSQLLQKSRNIETANLGEDEFIIQDYMPPGMKIKPGGRLATLQFKGKILDENTDELYNSTKDIVSSVYKNIITESV